MTSDRIPLAHVAHKNGAFGGAIAAHVPHAKRWKKEVAKFCGEMIADGYDIKTVYSREEYAALVDTLTIDGKARAVPPPPAQTVTEAGETQSREMQ